MRTKGLLLLVLGLSESLGVSVKEPQRRLDQAVLSSSSPIPSFTPSVGAPSVVGDNSEPPAAPSPTGDTEVPTAATLVGVSEAPTAPTLTGGSEAPVAPSLTEGSEASAAPSLTEGSEAPAAPSLAGGSEAPVAPPSAGGINLSFAPSAPLPSASVPTPPSVVDEGTAAPSVPKGVLGASPAPSGVVPTASEPSVVTKSSNFPTFVGVPSVETPNAPINKNAGFPSRAPVAPTPTVIIVPTFSSETGFPSGSLPTGPTSGAVISPAPSSNRYTPYPIGAVTTAPIPDTAYTVYPSYGPVAPPSRGPSTYESRDDDPFEGDKENTGFFNPGESPEEMVHDRNVAIALGVVVGIMLLLTILTAHQMLNNPDGICASICRLTVTCTCCLFKALCFPCRMLCGGGRAPAGPAHSRMMTDNSTYTHDLELS